MEAGLREIIITAITTAGTLFGVDKGVDAIRKRRVNEKIDHVPEIMGMTRTEHDRECDLKLKPLHDLLSEVRNDVKELLKKKE